MVNNELTAIAFDSEGQAAHINYNLPLPGSHTGKRIIKLELGLTDQDWTDAAKNAGQDAQQTVGKPPDSNSAPDSNKAANYIADRLKWLRVIPIPGPGPVESVISASAPLVMTQLQAINAARVDKVVSAFKNSIVSSSIQIPALTWSGELTSVSYDLTIPPEPVLLLVESWGISCFLGNYGMGRTVKTFTLLPGESTTITMRTWKSSQESIKQGSSIVDSHDESARTSFGDAMQHETTDKATHNSNEHWHVEAEVSASWGFGSAKVSGGAGGEYQSGHEEFAKQVDSTTQEHASQASAKRELSVTSSSELTKQSGEETNIERVINNVNVRRVLNFVFRELNQEYLTKVHLKEIRVAFTNGRLNSYREVPISGLRGLLSEYVQPNMVNPVAQTILKQIGVIFDIQDNPVHVLELMTLSDDGQNVARQYPPALVEGNYPAPTANAYYRFKRGPLGQGNEESNKVDGVLMKQNSVIMRTDSVIVEALLGQADALDEYAMQMQAATAEAKTIENQRAQLANQALAVADGAQRGGIYATMFNQPKEDGDE